ncbi:Butyrophilin-like protein 10 [Labeo rohita]|uniref:Butyrophilin-like protein 10 n=1 Tax=Labeo rohita TaxID=84645 RepID=A0ABQ8L004_LABRO|nr:Butyrophilin-like protein 10 [Labeo rohita]
MQIPYKLHIIAVDMRVKWSRLDQKDSLVHLCENHEERSDSVLQNHQEPQKGNASLKLSTAQIFDEGLYKCFIQSKSWNDNTTVNDKVEGHPPLITADEFDHSGGLHLQCESEVWYPEPDLEWLDSERV